jgi:signal transduction histidine kinase
MYTKVLNKLSAYTTFKSESFIIEEFGAATLHRMPLVVFSQLYRRTVFALAVVGALSLPSSTLFYYRLNQEKVASEQLTSVRQKADSVDELLTQLLNLETGTRGFAGTKDSRFLDPYWEGQRQLPGLLEELDTQGQFPELDNQVNQFLILSNKIIQNPSPALLRQGKQHMDKLRGILGELKTELEGERDRLINERRRRERRDLVLTIIAISSLLLLLWLTYQNAKAMKFAFDRAERSLELEEGLRLAKEEALKKQEEVSEAKSAIIQTISHEYRTPLTAILTAALLLEKDPPASDKFHRHINQIKKGVERLTRMTDDVLLVFRLDSERVQLNPVTIQLRPWFEALIESFPESSRVLLNIQVAEIYCDEGLLYKIFSNLIGNALKYSTGTVLVLVVAESNTICFIVRDSGIGIPSSMDLYGVFERGSNVGAVAGTGLGLAIVKKTVDLLDGQIIVESQENLGTEIQVILPHLEA